MSNELRRPPSGAHWLFICAPLLGALSFAGCLSSSTTVNSDMSAGTSGGDTTSGGMGGDSSPGSGGNGSVTTGSSGASMVQAGTGGVGGGAVGTGGTGGSGPVGGMTAGKVAAGVRWVGRVDTTDPSKPKFNWGGSGFVAQVTGSTLTVTINSDAPDMYQPVIDGKAGTRLKYSQGMNSKQLDLGGAGMHTVEFYRDTEASQGGVSQLISLTGATLQPAPTYSGRLIECIGDSLSNAFGELGNETHPACMSQNGCPYSIDTQANYTSYIAISARDLNADWSIVANSGWGLYRDLASGLQNVMPNVYDEAIFTSNNAPKWDFGIKASAVVINLGGNDAAMGDPGTPYQDAMVKLIGAVRGKYPEAWIFPVTGSMLNGAGLAAIKKYTVAAIATVNDPKVFYVDLGQQDGCNNPTGCLWHPNLKEHQRMATVLAPVIKTKLGW